MANPIVVVNVSVTSPPSPSTLQATGAFITQGGTILGAQNDALLTQLSDLTPLLSAPINLTSLAWSNAYGGEVTVTTSAAHGVTVGESFVTTIAGAIPAGFNGTYNAIATGASTFIYYLAVEPASTATTPGTYTPRGVGDLVAMATTYFGQGSQRVAYVLELGAGEPAAGVTALTSFINNSPQFFYSYLVPRNWDGNSSYLTFLAGYENPGSKTYFFTTSNLQNFIAYNSTMKDVAGLIEAPFRGVWSANVLTNAVYSGGQVTYTTTSAHGIAPGMTLTIAGCTPAGYNGTFIAQPGTTAETIIVNVPASLGAISVEGTLVASLYASAGVPATEYSLATAFYITLNYAPSSTNKVTQLEYAELFGVTAFPIRGNQAILTTISNANWSWVGTGSEGGVSFNLMQGGDTLDGNPFTFWYAVDWASINLNLNLANYVINGSQPGNPNPLYYNRDGINRLAGVCSATMASGISYGLVFGVTNQVGLPQATFLSNLDAGTYDGQAVVNAQPLTSYLTLNPSNYKIGLYGGLTVVMTPQLGFNQIIVNLNVNELPTQGG
jgi:hypothetical protein